LAFPPGANAAPDAISARVAANRSLFRERESKLQIETLVETLGWIAAGPTKFPIPSRQKCEQINESRRGAPLAG
jgi:hypothetical protein